MRDLEIRKNVSEHSLLSEEHTNAGGEDDHRNWRVVRHIHMKVTFIIQFKFDRQHRDTPENAGE